MQINQNKYGYKRMLYRFKEFLVLEKVIDFKYFLSIYKVVLNVFVIIFFVMNLIFYM